MRLRDRLGFSRRSNERSPGPFAVLALETTGLFPAYHHRIVEIAVVGLDSDRSVTDEWVSLVNPERDVGPTRIHGISARQVAEAPTFPEIAGDVVERLGDRVLVAHNGRFHADFLASEFGRLGRDADLSEILCTMTLASGLGVEGRTLRACCDTFGIVGGGQHDALADAHATAALLAALLDDAEADRVDVLIPSRISGAALPRILPSRRATRRGDRAVAPAPILAALADRLPLTMLTDDGSPDAVVAYVGLLDRALEDRHLDEAEVDALGTVASAWGLSPAAVQGIHARYFAGLRQIALADGRLTDAEREDLAVMGAFLVGSADAEEVAPPDVGLGVTDRRAEFVGKSVCFTGASVCSIDGLPLDRETQQELAADAGLVPVDGVTKKLNLLVLADPTSMSGKARKAHEYGIRLVAERAFWAALGVRVD